MNTDCVQIDSDYYLPVLMQKYFLDNPVGQKRAASFFKYFSTFLLQFDNMANAGK